MTCEIWWIDGCPADKGDKMGVENPPDKKNWIWITGDKVHWMIGEYGNTSRTPQKSFNAYSGGIQIRTGDRTLQTAKHQNIENFGPTVEGEYELNLKPDPNRLAKKANTTKLAPSKEGGIEKIPEGKYRFDWGNERIRLYPKNVKERYGRDVNSFYLHDSTKGYTAGCIEVDKEFFVILKKHRDEMINNGVKDMKISAIVKYPDANHKTWSR